MDSLSLKNERFLRQCRMALVCSAYTAGKPIADIAVEYGCAQSTVIKYVRTAGLSRYRKLAGIQCEVVAAYQRGEPIRDICDRFKVDRKSVWVWAVRAGIPLRQSRRAKEGGDG